MANIHQAGKWEEPSWSLGRLPAAHDYVMITNAGWKAVAVNFSTARDFPSSLSASSIELRSPVDSFNTLLLNYAGVSSPLTLDTLYIGSNAACLLFSSAVRAAENVYVHGAFTQTDFSEMRARNLAVGYYQGLTSRSSLAASGLIAVGGGGRCDWESLRNDNSDARSCHRAQSPLADRTCRRPEACRQARWSRLRYCPLARARCGDSDRRKDA